MTSGLSSLLERERRVMVTYLMACRGECVQPGLQDAQVGQDAITALVIEFQVNAQITKHLIHALHHLRCID